MPEMHSVVLAVSSEEGSHIRAHPTYFRKRANQCLRLAEEASDADAALVLRRLASAFQSKARALEGE